MVGTEAYQNVVDITSFSKSGGAIMYRTGITITRDEEIMIQLEDRVAHIAASPPVVSQKAAEYVMNNFQDLLSPALDELTANREIMCRGLEEQGFDFKSPDGGVYVWVDLKDHFDGTALQFLEKSLSEGLVIMPGEYFYENDHFTKAGSEADTTRVRLSFCNREASEQELALLRGVLDKISAGA
ncbi:hypothetical protein DID80_00625 [Candidatus Marinamargulisbacteria bacterium SCGC AAA071-K20]|nr:hypothetical protein DID80_00625 [Candidatus Marinamargulisbacteria bacterium SCGC AAA071-K20]